MISVQVFLFRFGQILFVLFVLFVLLRPGRRNILLRR